MMTLTDFPTHPDVREEHHRPRDTVSSVLSCHRPKQTPPQPEFPAGFRYSTAIVVTPISVGTETAEGDRLLRTHRPRTPIGEALLALRRSYLESGGQLQGWDEIEAEIRRRRGGLNQD